MDTIMVSVPTSVAVSLKWHKDPINVALGDKTPAWWGYVVEFALRQSAGDADAGMKEETEAKRREAVRAKFDKLARGEVPSGGRGPSGPRDADAKADSDWLASKGYKGAIKELDERWKGYVRALVIKKNADLARVENRDALEEAVAANLEKVQEMVRATGTWKTFRGLMEDDDITL